MSTVVIVDAVRTPIGKRNGGLSTLHPAEVLATVQRAVVDRTGIDPAQIGQVVGGCVSQIGEQAFNVGRNSALAAGFPESVVGTTIDRQCGSSQQAVHFAAQGVMSGTQDLVVAGGVQNMSMIPISSAMTVAQPMGFDDPFTGSEGWVARYGTQEVSQFRGAEMIAERWNITRDDMEAFAVESHERAIRARDAGFFEREIVPLAGVSADEGPREPNWDKIRSLPTLVEGGRITAAMASQISDAATAVLVVSERALAEHGLTPRARIHHLSVRGDDPIMMLSAPIRATEYALGKAGMTIDQIDAVEINEAFASVVLAWLAETGADPAKVNPNGAPLSSVWIIPRRHPPTARFTNPPLPPRKRRPRPNGGHADPGRPLRRARRACHPVPDHPGL